VKSQAIVVDPNETKRAAAILSRISQSARQPGAEVFEAFEELDGLSADAVRAVLQEKAGAALDLATCKALGLPLPPLTMRCTSARTKLAFDSLSDLEKEQVRLAGTTWDGLDLPASARLAKDGSEASFGDTLTWKTFESDTASDVPLYRFDVLVYRDGSGTIFTRQTPTIVGAVAYSVVEMSDARQRQALQLVLDHAPTASKAHVASDEKPAAATKAKAVKAKTDKAPKTTAPSESAPAKARAKAKIAEKSVAAPAKVKKAPAKAAAKKPTAKKNSVKVIAKAAAPKANDRATAKKTGAKPAPKAGAKKSSAKPAPKAGAKKSSAKPAPKPVARKSSAKPAPKPVAKKSSAKPAPKPVAKKSSTKTTKTRR
jgi:hypothetical protein